MLRAIKVVRIFIELHTPDRLVSHLEIDAAYFEYDIDPKGGRAIDHRLISAKVDGVNIRGLFFIEGVLEGTILDICSDCSGHIMESKGNGTVYIDAVGGMVTYKPLHFVKEVREGSKAFTLDKKIYPTIGYKVYRIPARVDGDVAVHFSILNSLSLDRLECRNKKQYKRLLKGIHSQYAETITISEDLSKAEWEFIETIEAALKK